MPKTRIPFVPLLIVLSLGAILASCAKQMENTEPAKSDSTATRDSLRSMFLQSVAQKLPGIWVHRSEDQGGIDEGYNLLPDGRLMLIGATTPLSGTRWSLMSDTLVLWMHTDPDTTSQPYVYFVKAIDDSALAIAAPNAAPGFHENYHRRNVTVPSRYTTFYKKEFTGHLALGASAEHTFKVTDLFDGGITLTSENSEVKFNLSRNGSLLTKTPAREWDGRFVPGEYHIKVVSKDAKNHKGVSADYSLDVEEK